MLRSLQDGSPVLVDGRRAPMVGRVSMDMIAVDVTELPDPIWAHAASFGAGFAGGGGRLPRRHHSYETLCGVRQRVPHEAI